jgi:hypothetical protein
LILSIEGNRTGDFSVKPGHCIADDLGDLCFTRIIGLRVVSTEPDEPLLDL